MRRKCAANIEFLLADDNLSELDSEGFDFINSFIVFQHIPVDCGYRLLQRLLTLLNEGGIGALHFTYRTQPPGGAITVKSIRGFLQYLRYRSYVVNGIVNVIQGCSFERPLPIMQMNEYDLKAIHTLFYENKCGEIYTRFTDHGGVLGVLLFFRKKSIAPL